ncbi:type II toxin-antitoxin system VapC family toxin [Adlercreutzia murintestinalis]|uniref:type II toxin-antitoxin system VapC family toxin n=1 Tax=Adlercreutzia murintestinalis TaxID=2941325 RepID=UPI0025581B8F|nr:type II toxin-antitoxin system VapC family toxin [Adlercreutzia murintestinalis]
MRYVVDTNIVSETMKAAPNERVLGWLEKNECDAFLTAITIEELRFGELMMPSGKKRAALHEWIDAMLSSYVSKMLVFDPQAAEWCARFHQQAIAAGRTPTIEDMMIAGIAQANNCALATRNVRDFDFLDLPIVNPFEEGSS